MRVMIPFVIRKGVNLPNRREKLSKGVDVVEKSQKSIRYLFECFRGTRSRNNVEIEKEDRAIRLQNVL